MIKAVFFDLDGTLLNSEKKISEGSKEALKKCREKGVQVYIATARPRTLHKMLPEWTLGTFDLFDGGIYCNGACRVIHDETDYTYIDSDAVHQVIETVNSFKDIHLVLQMKDEVHAFNYEFDETHIEEWGLQERRIVELDESCEHQTVKIMIYTHNMVNRVGQLPVELYEELKEKISDKANLYLTDFGEVIMVVPNQISKYSAIVEVCEKEGFKLDEIAVFGDDMNDMEMLSSIRHSIAMGNGVDMIKQTASYITLSNDDEGIVYGLKEILKVIE
jgi:Cof subfamily protein (haloacid dehalogenase superfamily)